MKHHVEETHIEKRLRELHLRIKKNYDREGTFIAVHPNDRTADGVYEFQIQVRPDVVKPCYFWNFIDTLANGQAAMEVGDANTTTADEAVLQWLATRKISIKTPSEKKAPAPRKIAVKAPAEKKAATPRAKAASKK